MKKRSNWLTAFVLAMSIATPTASATTKLYSAPQGVDRSVDFAVMVDTEKAFVFFVSENALRENYLPAADIDYYGSGKVVMRNTLSDPKNEVINKARESWVSFETDKSAVVRIAQLADPLPMDKLLLIDERGASVEHTIEGEMLSFNASAGHKYVLILNNDLSRRLTIFAETPETDVPDMNGADTFVIHPETPRTDYETTSRNTLYFAPGLHELGNRFPLRPGLQIYLAPGAYVRGYFTCEPNADTAGASDVKIFGRGILSSEHIQVSDGPNEGLGPRAIDFWSNSIHLGGFNREPAENQIVKDITIIYPSQRPIMGKGTNTLIDNVKVINFEKDMGGICIGSQSMVINCYVSTDTQALSSFGSNTSFSRNMIIGFEKGTPFYVGGRVLDDLKNITFEDSTVVGPLSSLMTVEQAHTGDLSAIRLKNIEVFYLSDRSNTSLLSLGVMFSPYRRGNYQGSIQNVEVSDIRITSLTNTPRISVDAYGFSERAAVRDVNVQNVQLNGSAAKLLPVIEQCAYNITIDGTTIKEGERPIVKEPKREYAAVEASKNPAKDYPRQDEDGDAHGRNIAHQIAYPTAAQEADPSFPKSLSAAFGNTATGASLEGIKTLLSPEGDFLQTYAAVFDPRMHTFHSPDYELYIAQKSSGTPQAKVQVYENIGLMNTLGSGVVTTPPMLTEHFANFTHRGSIEVTVRMGARAPAVENVLIMPSKLNIQPTFAADRRSFSFSVPSPEYLVVIVNGDWVRPLFVYGNPPEAPVPDPSDPAVLTIQPDDDFKTLENRKKLADYRVINFAPGYHDAGLFFPIFSNQMIYIPGDAYVSATIFGVSREKADEIAYGTKLITYNKDIFNYGSFRHGYRNKEDYVYVDNSQKGAVGSIENFTIRGRGILSAGKMDWFKGQEDVPSYIVLINRTGSNGLLDGLTLTNRHFHSANFFGSPALLSNTKILYGFHGNTDASQWGMVRRNLFSVQGDDGTYIKNGLDIDGWFAWQQNNANVFCFTRAMPYDGNTLGHSHIRNVTVIDGRYGSGGIKNIAAEQYNPMRGGFWLGINHDKNNANHGYLADVVLQNITFETIVNPLFQFAPMTGTKYNKMIGIEDITFDNIQVPMGQNWRSIFGVRPEAPDDHMRNITIKNLVIGDKKISSLDEFADTRSDGRNLEVIIE